MAAGQIALKYNGLEQRVSKSGSAVANRTGAAYYVYDGAGQLIGEYDANGVPIYETVYVNGLPVALVTQSRTGSGASLNVQTVLSNVYADHLNAPRVITRSSDDAIAWRWDGAEAFGATAPDQNPNGLGAFTFNQRFPGQIADVETGNFQNWNRDYQPSIAGRYIQPDPIGYLGGINGYAYVSGDPISRVDPEGLQIAPPLPWLTPRPIPGVTPRPLPITRDPIPWGIPEPLSPSDREFCRQERRACAELCEKAECDPDKKNIWGGSIEKCIRGCLPAKCGGNGVGMS